jgi:hypothetical protein
MVSPYDETGQRSGGRRKGSLVKLVFEYQYAFTLLDDNMGHCVCHAAIEQA